ncbi:AcrR family transcriptional regulator [Dysgonomonas alginatilytica]|uniref:AcrR family transcriptional regulator n=1 Tax=Dysgonomonas alginatilytica TaxID=1605892 RepID=A0A2V3PNU0_9BACT|nr:TetR/AcrR family transcriptional regulator [Dysgonomonas alginatilytica]PXV64363.1 AcrR family transcriptional regulator [Dysgonomonas alginatilytica]
MMENINNEKDRESTEKRLLEAVGDIIIKHGFDKVGVNAIASKAGVSKVLIYRYFGSIDNIIVEYLSQNDFWVSFSVDFPKDESLKEFIKKMFRDQIIQLRSSKLEQELYRWELTSHNGVIEKLRLKREAKGITLITIISQLAKHPQEEVAAIATLLSAAISYLVLLSDNCSMYNGIDLQSDKGWNQLASGIDLLVDKWYD